MKTQDIKRKSKPLFNAKGSVGAKIIYGTLFIICIIYAISILFPFAWSIMNSLKTKTEYNLDSFSFPKEFLNADNPFLALFSNYVKAFDKITVNGYSLIGMIFNSVWFAVATSALPLFFTAMVSYVFSKYNFIGKKFLYTIAIIMIMIPILSNFPAQYKLYHTLHLVNSPLILIPYMNGFTGGTMLILLASFSGVSWSYAESAQMDGANAYTIYFKIMLPQILPQLLTLFILSFIGGWNDYMTPYLYLKSMPTLATGLMEFEKQSTYKPDWPIFYAGVTMMAMPIVILFACFSDKIMGSVSMGGLKG